MMSRLSLGFWSNTLALSHKSHDALLELQMGLRLPVYGTVLMFAGWLSSRVLDDTTMRMRSSCALEGVISLPLLGLLPFQLLCRSRIKRINTRQTEPATPRTPDSHVSSVSVNGLQVVILFTAPFTTAAIVAAIILLQVVNQVVH